MNQQSTTAASELVSGLLKFPAPSEAFVLVKSRPGEPPKEFRFRVALLRGFEEAEVLLAAQKYARDLGELQGYLDIYREAQAHELVARCLVADEPYDRPDGTSTFHRVFTSGQQVRENLVNSEVAQIINAYEVIKQKFSCMTLLAGDNLDDWIRQIGDELMGPSFLSRVDSSLLAPLLLLCAQRLAKTLHPTEPTSSTSPDSGESDPSKSSGGTGSFTTLPAMRSADDAVSFPTDRQLDPLEAAELAEKL
jgi:hypothetical protein